VDRKQRHEVMSEEEIKQAEKYLDYCRSAYKDKDQRGLFDKWEEIDQYWEGDINESESDTDPGSNTNIIHPNIEGQVALLVEQNIAIQPKPRGPSDAPFTETVRIIAEWIKDQNKMKRKLDVHERRREKFGTGIFRVLFDPDMLDGFGLPLIEPCNPAYVFVDPTITDIYKIQEGRFLIEVMNKSISWAETYFDEDLVKAIQPGFHPMEDEMLFGEDKGETDEISKDSYLHMFVWTKKKGKLRMVQMSGCGIILWNSEKEEDVVYPKNKYPYFFTPLYYREGTVWAKGDAELLIKTQDLTNDLDDQIRINARLTGNVQKVIGISSGIDPDKWTNEPGLNVTANDIHDWKVVQPGQLPSYVIERRNFAINTERQITTRFSDQMVGNRVNGVDTATEALALQQAGTTGIDHKKILLQETLGEVFEYCLELAKEHYTEEMAFRITEKQDDFIWFRGSDLKQVPYLIPAPDSLKEQYYNRQEEPPQWVPLPEYNEETDELTGETRQNATGNLVTKDAAFDIEVTVGAGLPNNKAFVYNVIKEAYRDKVISVREARKLLKDYAALPVEEELPPEMMPQEQVMPEQVMPQEMPEGADNPEIAGLSPSGNPAALGMMGGESLG